MFKIIQIQSHYIPAKTDRPDDSDLTYLVGLSDDGDIYERTISPSSEDYGWEEVIDPATREFKQRKPYSK